MLVDLHLSGGVPNEEFLTMTDKLAFGMQAAMLGKMMAAQHSASGQQGMLSPADLKGVSNTAQKEAAKVLEFAYNLAAGLTLAS